ncbi:outer membrane protein [Escherichia coli]|uniref:Outer membrane protein n=1 Tax=Escherichia coli TaxID=562 RepID=A0A376TGA8_ECOLX|nr:outer membrane protein [Escherichia coli]
MKIISLFCLACWSWLVVQPLLSQKHPKPPQIGMANPASVYCQQRAGRSFQCNSARGQQQLQITGRETIDEWALWRRDHPAGEK